MPDTILMKISFRILSGGMRLRDKGFGEKGNEMTNPDQIFLYVDNKRVSLAKFMNCARKARTVYARGCTGLTALPDLPNALTVDVSGCTGLTAFPDLPNALTVYVSGCTGLTALPDLPNAEYVDASGCKFDKTDPNFHYLFASCDSRGYLFEAICIRGRWRIIAGCRNYNLAEAREHWGPRGQSDRPDCLALVEKLAQLIGEVEIAEAVKEGDQRLLVE